MSNLAPLADKPADGDLPMIRAARERDRMARAALFGGRRGERAHHQSFAETMPRHELAERRHRRAP